MQINAQTVLNMIIGYPLKHSYSPRLHQMAYEKLNVNAVLLAFTHSHIEILIETIRALSVGLVAVTMPFKSTVLSYTDELSEEVKILGAANTLIQKSGKIKAYNTDVMGIQECLKNLSLSGKSILILGAGGAARAVAYALKDIEKNLYWFNRTLTHVESMAKQWGGIILNSVDNKIVFDLIINTTSLGMFPDINDTPLPGYHFESSQIVFDLIYNPKETRLLREAKAAGAKTISGMEMFIIQGLQQIELFLDNFIEKTSLVSDMSKALS